MLLLLAWLLLWLLEVVSEGVGVAVCVRCVEGWLSSCWAAVGAELCVCCAVVQKQGQCARVLSVCEAGRMLLCCCALGRLMLLPVLGGWCRGRTVSAEQLGSVYCAAVYVCVRLDRGSAGVTVSVCEVGQRQGVWLVLLLLCCVCRQSMLLLLLLGAVMCEGRPAACAAAEAGAVLCCRQARLDSNLGAAVWSCIVGLLLVQRQARKLLLCVRAGQKVLGSSLIGC